MTYHHIIMYMYYQYLYQEKCACTYYTIASYWHVRFSIVESKPKPKPKRALKKTNSSSLDAVAENSSDEQSNPRPVFV